MQTPADRSLSTTQADKSLEMSVRMVALEYYRAMKEVEELEKKIASLPSNSPQKDEIERELRAARTERDRIKKMLDGAKAR